MTHPVRTGLIASGLALAVMIATLVVAWMQLPADGAFPVHWNAAGEADQFAGRDYAMALLAVIPGVTLLVSLLLAIAPKIEPRRFNLQRSMKAYVSVWVAVMALLSLVMIGIAVALIRGAGGEMNSQFFFRAVISGTSLLFVVIGNYLPKTRSSFFFGIRTPWTLTSDIAWERTHRLAGKLLIGAGVVGGVAAFILDGLLLALFLPALVLGATITSAIYSYFAWRSADDREQRNGSTI